MLSNQFIKDTSFLGTSLLEELPFKLCLILLNSGTYKHELFMNLCRKCDFLICADGGANFLYDHQEREEIIPKAIVGDLDSFKPEARKYYESKGTKIC